MTNPFDLLLNAARSLCRHFAAGLPLLADVWPSGCRPEMKALRPKLQGLWDAYDELDHQHRRFRAVGLPKAPEGYPGGAAGWTFDVEHALENLLTAASEAVDAVAYVLGVEGILGLVLQARWDIDPLDVYDARLRQALEGLKALADRVAAKGAKEPITLEEANQAVNRLAEARGRDFLDGGVREWAAAVEAETGKSCSTGTVRKTLLWIATMDRTNRGRRKGGKPRVASLTPDLEAVTPDAGAVKPDEEALERLTREHRGDYEPSPLEDRPQKVQHHRKL
jgi:hypothetical protein